MQIYEYTTQIAVTPDLKYKGAEAGIVPVQVIFALKEQNQKKINSKSMQYRECGLLSLSFQVIDGSSTPLPNR